MGRAYHSASSIALGRRCRRAWFYQYVIGVRAPRVTWADVVRGDTEIAPRDRSTALGGEVHARIEGWYQGAPVGHDLPGLIAASGMHRLPHPDTRGIVVHVEHAIGSTPLPEPREAHAPPVVYEAGGVRWAGFRDLVALAPDIEWARLGIVARNGWALFDHKTSADIWRYGLTPAKLEADFQCNLYALATCDEHRIDSVAARWVYYATKSKRECRVTDVTIHADAARAIVHDAAALALELDAIEVEADAPCTPTACGDYGGCPHHISAGGPCDARRSLGSLIQARVKGTDPIMSIQSKFAALKAGDGATTPADAPPADATADAPPATPAAAPRGRPRKAAPPAVVVPPVDAFAPPAGDERTITTAGVRGPITITGDAADVLDVLIAIRAI